MERGEDEVSSLVSTAHCVRRYSGSPVYICSYLGTYIYIPKVGRYVL